MKQAKIRVVKKPNRALRSTMCIYQPIRTGKLHGTLYKHLRQSHKKRKKQYGSTDKRGKIRNRVSVENAQLSLQKTALEIGSLTP